ncbi:translation initiation factor IF-2-like [Leopardus geoffroyi]|uniref:translation initiation factor IF-2-like n=1 Tax=Leopardus geoffroyi TaxID=46844 RepID=UPI001E261816|nr:translation initiation factor IF-2-like [Leopardus geoffroyi]
MSEIRGILPTKPEITKGVCGYRCKVMGLDDYWHKGKLQPALRGPGRRQRDRTAALHGADSGGAPGAGRRGARPGGRPARRPRRPGPGEAARHLPAPAALPGGSGPGRPRGPPRRGGRSRSPPRTQSGSAGARLTCSTGRRGPSRTIGPRSGARVTAQASRCRLAPPPPPPFPPARRRLVPAVRLLHSPGPGAACAAPRLRLDPSRPRLRRLRRARLARSPRTARGKGAQPLEESHRRPRRPLRAPTLRSAPLAPRRHESEPVIGQSAAVKGQVRIQIYLCLRLFVCK